MGKKWGYDKKLQLEIHISLCDPSTNRNIPRDGQRSLRVLPRLPDTVPAESKIPQHFYSGYT